MTEKKQQAKNGQKSYIAPHVLLLLTDIQTNHFAMIFMILELGLLDINFSPKLPYTGQLLRKRNFIAISDLFQIIKSKIPTRTENHTHFLENIQYIGYMTMWTLFWMDVNC